MKSILINPFDRTISEVEYSGNYQQIYDLIDCETYDCARINKHGDAIFVDDEGLISEKPQAFFLHEDYPQPLAGKGLVLGCRASDGETIAPTTTIGEVAAKVRWVVPIRINGEVTWLPAEFLDMGLLKEEA